MVRAFVLTCIVEFSKAFLSLNGFMIDLKYLTTYNTHSFAV